jgi:hypothetical protein
MSLMGGQSGGGQSVGGGFEMPDLLPYLTFLATEVDRYLNENLMNV